MDEPSTLARRMWVRLFTSCFFALITSCSILASDQPRLIVYTHQAMSTDQFKSQLIQCDITTEYTYLRTIFGNGHVVQFHAVESATLIQKLQSTCAKKFINAIDVDSHVKPYKN